MKAYILHDPKDWIRCPVCGDKRIGKRIVPVKFRGKMRFDEKRGKMVCNKCDFSFAFSELKPKKEFLQTIKIMEDIGRAL